MSWGPLIHGHAPKGLLKALGAAAARGTSFGAPTELETRLAQRVAMLMPSMERVRFVSSGTEAAMSAVRVARAATRRDKIVKFEGCYHGHADAFLVQAGSGAMTLGVPTSPGVPAAVAADTAARALQRPRVGRSALFERHAGPDRGDHRRADRRQHGAWSPPRRGIPAAACARSAIAHGILLVFDEVISGFRAAAGGAQQVFGVRPDLTCLGKIIGGGLPVGAYGGRADVMELVAPAGPVYQAGTLSGNPLAMTAGLWSLSELSPKLYRHLAKLGAQLAAGLADAARAAGGAAAGQRVRIAGDAVLHAASRCATTVRAQGRHGAPTAGFSTGMLARGVYPPPSQFEAWFLSGAHTETGRREDGEGRQSGATR